MSELERFNDEHEFVEIYLSEVSGLAWGNEPYMAYRFVIHEGERAEGLDIKALKKVGEEIDEALSFIKIHPLYEC